MTTKYRGLFVQKLSDGTIVSVQVEDPNGYGMDLEPDDYSLRKILPPIDKLPDQFEYPSDK